MTGLTPISRLLPLVKVAGELPGGTPDRPRLLPRLAPGQHVQGIVEAELPGGALRIRIAGQALQMSLPVPARRGDALDLVYVTSQPRPAFLLAGINSLSHFAALSETGRFIDSLVRNPQRSDLAQPLASARPLLPGAPSDGKELAAALRQSIAQSGLFYESHLAQWAAGEHPLAQLLEEPQGRLSPASGRGAESATPGRETPSVGNQDPRLAPTPAEGELSPRQEPEQHVAETTADDLASPARNPSHPADPRTLNVVQQQLEALENRQFAWRGEVWPDQWVDWDVAERPPAEAGVEEPVQWQTRLHLTLPSLGEVAATLRLDTTGVRIAVSAEDEARAAIMKGCSRALLQQMERAGVQVLGLTVNGDGGN